MANHQSMQNMNVCFYHNEKFFGNMCPQCAISAQQQAQSPLAIGNGGVLTSNGTWTTAITTTTTGSGTAISIPGKINIVPTRKKNSKVLLLINH